MFNPLLQAAVDTVTVVKDTGFDFKDFALYMVGAIVTAVLAYLGGKRGADKAVSGR